MGFKYSILINYSRLAMSYLKMYHGFIKLWQLRIFVILHVRIMDSYKKFVTSVPWYIARRRTIDKMAMIVFSTMRSHRCCVVPSSNGAFILRVDICERHFHQPRRQLWYMTHGVIRIALKKKWTPNKDHTTFSVNSCSKVSKCILTSSNLRCQ